MLRLFLIPTETAAQRMRPAAAATPVYDAELDHVLGLLDDACEVLADADAVRFHVEGFGESPWPVDVWADLPMFLEQLPDLMEWLGSTREEEFQLGFYEQGTERRLLFTKMGGDLHIRCESWGHWQPDPSEERITRSDLERMLSDLAQTFVEQVREFAPQVYSHEWFEEWRQRVGNGGGST